MMAADDSSIYLGGFTAQVGRSVLSEGWQPIGANAAFIKGVE